MIVVIGCGNANRSDDGLGPAVIKALRQRARERARPDVVLLDAGTDGMAVMFAARGCSSLIVVDSSKTGAEPGAIFEVPGDELAAAHEPSLNLHDFRWDHALHAGRRIFGADFPRDVVVLLVEARALGLGLSLSPEIEAAVAKICLRIEALIAARLAGAGVAAGASAKAGPGLERGQ